MYTFDSSVKGTCSVTVKQNCIFTEALLGECWLLALIMI